MVERYIFIVNRVYRTAMKINNSGRGARGIIRGVDLMRALLIGPNNGVSPVNLPGRIGRLHRL